MSFLLTTFFIEEIHEYMQDDLPALAAEMLQDYRSGALDASSTYSELLKLRQLDPDFFPRMARKFNSGWLDYVLLLGR